MCKFILQEAKEKANEIRIKTEHDFHKDKQLRVIAANQKTDAAFEQQKIQLESDKKVGRDSHMLCCSFICVFIKFGLLSLTLTTMFIILVPYLLLWDFLLFFLNVTFSLRPL